jgi:hypothetical protein
MWSERLSVGDDDIRLHTINHQEYKVMMQKLVVNASKHRLILLTFEGQIQSEIYVSEMIANIWMVRLVKMVKGFHRLQLKALVSFLLLLREQFLGELCKPRIIIELRRPAEEDP